MEKRTVGDSPGGAKPVAITADCPVCTKHGTLESIGGNADINLKDGLRVGHRRCPNRKCWAHLFVVIKEGELHASFPPQRLTVSTDDVPAKVASALNEAIECHANQCYRSAGMMIRRTLEEVCEEKDAEGKDLHNRLKDLRDKVILSPVLIEAMDELKLLGNDAAHVHSRDYDEIGSEEITVAVDLTKAILQSLYQHKDLVARLKSFRKDAPTD
jgi:hypothetical protein